MEFKNICVCVIIICIKVPYHHYPVSDKLYLTGRKYLTEDCSYGLLRSYGAWINMNTPDTITQQCIYKHNLLYEGTYIFLVIYIYIYIYIYIETACVVQWLMRQTHKQ